MLTHLDYERITTLLAKTPMKRRIETLIQKVENAPIINSADVPPDLVTMNSVVVFYNEKNNLTHEIRLVYSVSATDGDQTSVLTPLGTSLLGSRTNDVLTYKTSYGKLRTIRILKISYQPEAN